MRRRQACTRRTKPSFDVAKAQVSSKNPVAKAIYYGPETLGSHDPLLDDGRVCLSSNAAECALRGIAIGRHNWAFAAPTEAASVPPPSIR